jgi:hypothetical protein
MAKKFVVIVDESKLCKVGSVQLETRLDSACLQRRWKLRYNQLLRFFACNLKLRPYSSGLGPGFALPVEITPFCHMHTLRTIAALPSLKASPYTVSSLLARIVPVHCRLLLYLLRLLIVCPCTLAAFFTLVFTVHSLPCQLNCQPLCP